MADRTVPWVFALAGLALATTGEVDRTRSILLVDYSCALKLTIPLTIRAGILALAERDVLVKGGKWIERLARIDTVALDKTGTLTEGRPRVAAIVPLNGYDRDFILRTAPASRSISRIRSRARSSRPPPRLGSRTPRSATER